MRRGAEHGDRIELLVCLDHGSEALKGARGSDAELPVQDLGESGVGAECVGSTAIHVQRGDEEFPSSLVKGVRCSSHGEVDDRVVVVPCWPPSRARLNASTSRA